MKAREFIEEYLSPCDDNIVCLHAPDKSSGEMFTIHGWRTGNTDEPLTELYLEYEVSQIRAKIENYNYNLAVVIHIYTDYSYEEGK